MNNYVNSDLAVESKGIFGLKDRKNASYSEEEEEHSTICRLSIEDKETSAYYGRDIGHYVTVFCDKLWLMDGDAIEGVAATVSRELRAMLERCCEGKDVRDISVLIAGLGNSEITADAIGPLTVSGMTVTRHLESYYKKIFGDRKVTRVSAVIPGVLSQTGIETLEIVRSAARSVKPDAVVAIDALAARNCERLGATIQLSDNGISPGSGIGNMRKAINRENLGVPVIALGVPTVAHSSTLVYDALEKAGIDKPTPELTEVLENGKGFFVSPKESDVITRSVSELLSLSLDITFGTRL